MTAWNNQNKNTSNFSNIEKSSTASFLLKEDSFYLLLESGDKIVLSYGTDWSNQTKN